MTDKKNWISEPEQREISRLVSLAGQMLLQHGAESKLVVDTCSRLGIALGIDDIELALSASSIVVTTITRRHCITTTRSCPDRGINMWVISDIQQILVGAEKGLLDTNSVKNRLNSLSPQTHNRWLVAIMAALSCAAFSLLSGGDVQIFIATFCAAFVGMIVRQELTLRRFNAYLTFGLTAFIATLISSFSGMLHLGNEPYLVMASSVIMLVPGFPLINAASDLVKGYVNMGMARGMVACLLTLSISLGIVAAMNLTGIWGWE